ncbi:hypothetical protein CTA1_12988 [Colletotrichum tanaceti]|uniref:Uncharacterized protein n=1 Tax=Colletotrichum tanaceti TaxID=1306861 RepID=A0A4U6X1C5_9PEZI|nr:hypothetical protein CTA1_12988 [Colletotrichum tanaceti]
MQVTYSNYYKVKLRIVTTAYNLYLLLTSAANENFSLVSIQTNNTIALSDAAFNEIEEKELTKASLLAKLKEYLSTSNPLMFNSSVITINNSSIVTLKQKG